MTDDGYSPDDYTTKHLDGERQLNHVITMTGLSLVHHGAARSTE